MTNPEQTTFVDVEVIDVASPDNAIDVTVTGNPVIEIGDMGGPVGPPGPATPTATGAGFPADTVGVTGAMYKDTTTNVLYGPKLAAAAAGLPNQQLISNMWFGQERAATNIAPMEIGTQFEVVAGAIDLTAVRFFREYRDIQATTQITVWNAVTTAQIHRTTVAVPIGYGWRNAPLSATVRLTPGKYIVSYGLITAGTRSSHPKDVSLAVPQAANVKYVMSMYGPVPGNFPNATAPQYPSLVDPVFTPVTTWHRTEVQTLPGNGPPAEALGYVGDNYTDTKAGVQYGPKLAAVVAQPPSQSLFYPAYFPNTLSGQPALEVGMHFEVNAGGLVNGVRYYRAGGDTQTTRSVRLWSYAGAKLAEATSTTEPLASSGWRYIPFASPVRIAAGSYVVSYDVAANNQFGWIAAVTPGAPTRNLSWGYGRNGDVGTFPTITQPNWWAVDVDFTPELMWAPLGAIRPAQVDVYTGVVTPTPVYNNFLWTKPAGARLIQVICQGGGAGGGSGRRGAAGTVRSGGGGGGGGMRTEAWIAAKDVPDTVTVRVGSAGKGGAAVTTNDTNGNDGQVAYASDFVLPLPNVFSAYGGSMGYGGTTTTGPAAGGPLGTGPSGAGGAVGVASSNAINMWMSAFGGGGGGGVNASNAFGAGGNAFRGQFSATEYGVTAGAATDGAAGVVPPITAFPAGYPWGFGGGGSGGAGSVAGPGGKGGDGIRGGGGGGGGGSTNGQPSGAGGDGGPGYVMVITYF